MFGKLIAWINRYERHLSAFAMFGGFVLDNVFFSRIDLIGTQAVFLGYILVCVLSIALLHRIETRGAEGRPYSRFRSLLPIATQFALGGFWSGLLIFYGRGAVFSVSWPFLLLLLAIFFGNEILSKYHSRLVFTTSLFFFALYAYAILLVPVYTGSIGVPTFLLSGAVAIGVFALFTRVLRLVGKERFSIDVWRIRFWAGIVLAVINISYFTHVLPPLPLALQAGGIYHQIIRTGDGYAAQAEPQSWNVAFGAPEHIRVVVGEALYAYSAIFAPIKLTTTISHRWQRYHESTNTWVTESTVSFPISGGRDGGYRGYSIKTNPGAGTWRVEVVTGDGRVVGRLRFVVEEVAAKVPTTTTTL